MHFYSKMAWPPVTYDVINVTMATDSHRTCVKMRVRLRNTLSATENGRCRWKIVFENFKKNLMRGGWDLPPSPCTSEGWEVKRFSNDCKTWVLIYLILNMATALYNVYFQALIAINIKGAYKCIFLTVLMIVKSNFSFLLKIDQHRKIQE